MRDPRTYGPYQPGRLPSILDYLDSSGAPPVAAPSMAAAAAPQPTIASRIAGLAQGVGGALASLPPVNLLTSLNDALQTGRQQNQLKTDQMRLANEAAQRQAQLEQAQLPAQQALAEAQAREQATLTDRIGQTQDPRLRDSLIRGAATNTFRPFEVEPGPAELAAYQAVLGMKEEEARQRLIGQREQRQAQLEAGLNRETNRQRLGGEFQLEQLKRSLGPKPADAGDVRQLRQEFEQLPQVKNFAEVSQAYRIIRDVEPTKAGDLTLLTKYMKLIDPTSSVREGELATADNAGGVPGQIVSLYNRFLSDKGRLSDSIREDFRARAKQLYDSYSGAHQSIADQYRGFATSAGIDPKDVVTDFSMKDEPKATASAAKPTITPEQAAAELRRRRGQ